jgi:pyruvate,water dikinase
LSEAGKESELTKPAILWLNDVRNVDVAVVGGKNASLGEMIHAGLQVPNGFAVTAFAYERYIEATQISKKIYDILKKTITNSTDPKQYEVASKSIRELIEKTPMPKDIEKSIRQAYEELNKRYNLKDTFVAVRSSATAEDLPDASFAGQQETYLNVKGPEDLIDKVVKCWSSLFTSRAIFYREEKKFEHDKVFISVGVQKMVNARTAGVMFTINPVTGDQNEVIIECTFGLGEAVVSGAVNPDSFVVDKITRKIKHRRIAKKTVEYIRDPQTGKTVHADITDDRVQKPCITDEEIMMLVDLGNKIEKHYGKAMDIEWAIDQDLPSPSGIFSVQARPETVWSKNMKNSVDSKEKIESLKIAVKGICAGKRGYGFGVAKVATTTDEAANMKKGDILVTDMTNPDFVPYMKIASAIVTDKGGITSHAAIVSRELNIPCVVGTEIGTQLMKTGKEYTVDSRNGIIYEGVVAFTRDPTDSSIQLHTVDAPAPVTATKIYMNMAIPEKIEEYKNLPFQGIGLMRAEFIFAAHVNEHPMSLVEKGEHKKLVDSFAEGVATVARAIQPRIVVVRFSDFKTNEYRDLVGGEKYEIVEENPMLGWRGCSRYISKWYEQAFRLECQAIKKCRDEWGLKNVYVMLPMVRTLWEAKQVLEIMRQEGLERSRDFKVWFMAETPSIIVMADEFSKLVDGFSIGSNDLTQGTLMIDRDSERLGQMGYFDERDPAVKRMIAHLIKVAHENGCTVSICGEGPSNLPDFCEFLIRAGIDSISVNNDAVAVTRRNVAGIEQKIILERLAEAAAIAAGQPLKKPIPDWEW